MATTINKQRNLKYLNREFSSLKRDFVEHLKVYFPDTVQDFNESSVGMMLTELGAFIGDNLSFYLDKRFNESFIVTALETKSIYKHAKQLGFKLSGAPAASGKINAFLKVPATQSNGNIIPDMRYAGKIMKGAQLKSKAGQSYETLVDIDFSTVNIEDSNYVVPADIDPKTKQPKSFALLIEGNQIEAGETKTTTFTVGAYRSFPSFSLQDLNVLQILSVIDAESNDWYEVDFLAQDTVFDGVANTGMYISEVPYVLKLRSVPYRFITDYDPNTGKTSLIFGSGDASVLNGELIPDLGNLSLPLYGKDTFTDYSLDPQNFLKTDTLGIAPANTTLTVKYRVGGGLLTNAGSGQVSTVTNSVFNIGDTSLPASVVRDVSNSFSVTNPAPIAGGKEALSVDELRQLLPAGYFAQSRTVTAQDFIARCMSMPSKFGAVFRANVKLNPLNANSVEIIILSLDNNGFVTIAPQQLKDNLATYLSKFRMLTDAIEIMDGQIINFGLNFKILTNADYNKSSVLTDCINALTDHFNTNTQQLNQPINLTDIYILLAGVQGVLSVVDLTFTNKVGIIDGRNYSNTTYNITQNTKNGIIYCQENAIFELKYKTKDIVGVAI